MMLSLLVAAADDNVIGIRNELPWRLPGDLKYFKNLTWGMPILMGRKTFESIGKPLPGRHSIVITRNPEWRHEGVEAVASLEAALEAAQRRSVKELFIIGGAEIFRSALPLAGRVYLTRIYRHYEGDTFFPELGPEWTLQNEHVIEAENNTPRHSFQVWERTGENERTRERENERTRERENEKMRGLENGNGREGAGARNRIGDC